MAVIPRSPVLILMISTMGETKILPSPILPVRAAKEISCTTVSTSSSSMTASIFNLDTKY